MQAPSFVADFDSATGLLRALSASLQDKPFRRLGRSRFAGAAVAASRCLPESGRLKAFAVAGGGEAIPPAHLPEVDPEEFAARVASGYPQRGGLPAVAIGSSNGAVMHLCASMRIPWLPQTFLVPVRRDRDPDDCESDATLAAEECGRLLERQPGLQIHQMHDPNQDRLMVTRLAYFRMKLRTLPTAYSTFLRRVLAPGATIIVVDCGLTWPVTELADRHCYQHGAVGGLRPEEYVHGSPRVEAFLAAQNAPTRKWHYPLLDGEQPEAEWGYEAALTPSIADFAAQHGFRLAKLSFPEPDTVSPLIADLHQRWLVDHGVAGRRLLAETFICVEPTWARRTGAVPLWLTFGTQPSLAVLESYLQRHPAEFADLVVTLFPHGVRSAGYAPAADWLHPGRSAGLTTTLAGVRPDAWPADFATLAHYSRELWRLAPPPTGPSPRDMPLSYVSDFVNEYGAGHGVRWTAR